MCLWIVKIDETKQQQKNLFDEDVIWMMKLCDLHFLTMLRDAHTSKNRVIWHFVNVFIAMTHFFFVLLSLCSHSLRCNSQFINKRTHTDTDNEWSWTRYTQNMAILGCDSIQHETFVCGYTEIASIHASKVHAICLLFLVVVAVLTENDCSGSSIFDIKYRYRVEFTRRERNDKAKPNNEIDKLTNCQSLRSQMN